METSTLRKELHQYIDESDDKLIKMVYALVKEYNEEDDFTDERIKLILKERANYLRGEGASYSWEEVKAIIRKK